MSKDIFKEQWGDQLAHLGVGILATYSICTLLGSALAVGVPALGWIYWEHRQFPNHNSKGYDDANLDRAFQELGLLIGVGVYLT